MATQEQTTAVSKAIDAIRQAAILLTDQIADACETSVVVKLTREYENLDRCLSLLLQLQNATDDKDYEQATTHIKSSADGLQAQAAAIQAIVHDEQTAGKVIAYITEAAAMVAEL